MKLSNLKLRKRLGAIFLSGTIALTTTGCSFTKNLIPNKTYNGEIVNLFNDPNGEESYDTIPETFIENVFGYDTNWDLVVYNKNIGFVYHADIDEKEHDLTITPLKGTVTTTARLNFRVGPTTDYSSQQVLPKGAKAEVLGITDNNWYLIKYDGKIGIVCGSYVKYTDEELTKDLTGNGTYGYTTTGVNFRVGPSTDFDKITTLSKGTKVEYVDYLSNGWYCVKYKNTIGYLYGKYLSYDPNQQYTEDKVNPIGEYRTDITKLVYASKDTPLLDQASPTSESSYTVSKFEACEVLEEVGAWYKVRCNGIEGYVNKFDTTLLQDTVVVVDISRQILTLYKDGVIILETDVVTGKKNTHDTPIGLYSINYKQQDTYLKGADYRCHVDYWMPFYYGYGLHDADWRNTFGGNIYENNGSHGCVNIPHDYASGIYNNVSSGTKVLVHK